MIHTQAKDMDMKDERSNNSSENVRIYHIEWKSYQKK